MGDIFITQFKNENISQLLYKVYPEKETWTPLPAWTIFYENVGQLAFQSLEENRKLIIALSVPTRSFAAAFTSLGVVRSYLECTESNESDHFEQLCKLPHNTPLVLRTKDKVKHVFLEEIVHSYGEIFLKVCVVGERKSHGPGSILIPKHYSQTLQRVFDDTTSNTKFMAGREISMDSEFLQNYINNAAALNQLISSQLECAIVGTISNLNKEIFEYNLAIKTKERLISGTLNDILFAKRGQGSTGVNLTRIFPSNTSTKLPPNLKKNPVVIFDGSNSFLNCSSNFKTNCWIVILDKTEPNFDIAVELINKDAESPINRLNLDNLKPLLPWGVEVSGFEVQL